jgi:hypothetical protein
MKINFLFVLLIYAQITVAQNAYKGVEHSYKGETEVNYKRYLKTGIDDLGDNATQTTTFITQYKIFDAITNQQILAIAPEHFKAKEMIIVYVVCVDNGKKLEAKYYVVKLSEFDGLCYERIEDGKTVLQMCFMSEKKEHVKINTIKENYFNLITYDLD